MAEDKRRVVLRALPALIRVPPDEVNFLRILIQIVFVIARPAPDTLGKAGMYFKCFHLTDIHFSKQLVKPRKHYSRPFDNLTMTCSKLPDVHTDYHQ